MLPRPLNNTQICPEEFYTKHNVFLARLSAGDGNVMNRCVIDRDYQQEWKNGQQEEGNVLNRNRSSEDIV
jgi:hypothetical protein